MSVTRVENLVTERNGDTLTIRQKREWIVDSASDVSSITNAAPGSVAYTADLSYMAMFDGTEWVTIGG